jgi:pimeloyl-ACP methyl ester carboxylesterase
MRPADRWAVLDGRRIRYWLEGDGPSIVVIGGLGTTVADWAALMPDLSRLGRVLVHDRAGLGASDADPEPRTAGRMADDLRAVIAQSGLEPPYLLVGHSWGGLVARLLAHQTPDKMAGLVLVDATHEDTVSRGAATLNHITYGLLRGLATIGVLGPILRRTRTYQAYPPEDLDDILSDLRTTTTTARREALAIPASLRELTSAQALTAVLPCPVVALSAGGVTPHRGPTARVFARLHTLHRELLTGTEGGYHQVVDGSGHYIHLDRPKSVLEAVSHLTGQ